MEATEKRELTRKAKMLADGWKMFFQYTPERLVYLQDKYRALTGRELSVSAERGTMNGKTVLQVW